MTYVVHVMCVLYSHENTGFDGVVANIWPPKFIL